MKLIKFGLAVSIMLLVLMAGITYASNTYLQNGAVAKLPYPMEGYALISPDGVQGTSIKASDFLYVEIEKYSLSMGDVVLVQVENYESSGITDALAIVNQVVDGNYVIDIVGIMDQVIVTPANVMGRVAFTNTTLGFMLGAMHGITGYILFCGIPLILIVLLSVATVRKSYDKYREDYGLNETEEEYQLKSNQESIEEMRMKLIQPSNDMHAKVSELDDIEMQSKESLQIEYKPGTVLKTREALAKSKQEENDELTGDKKSKGKSKKVKQPKKVSGEFEEELDELLSSNEDDELRNLLDMNISEQTSNQISMIEEFDMKEPATSNSSSLKPFSAIGSMNGMSMEDEDYSDNSGEMPPLPHKIKPLKPLSAMEAMEDEGYSDDSGEMPSLPQNPLKPFSAMGAMSLEDENYSDDSGEMPPPPQKISTPLKPFSAMGAMSLEDEDYSDDNGEMPPLPQNPLKPFSAMGTMGEEDDSGVMPLQNQLKPFSAMGTMDEEEEQDEIANVDDFNLDDLPPLPHIAMLKEQQAKAEPPAPLEPPAQPAPPPPPAEPVGGKKSGKHLFEGSAEPTDLHFDEHAFEEEEAPSGKQLFKGGGQANDQLTMEDFDIESPIMPEKLDLPLKKQFAKEAKSDDHEEEIDDENEAQEDNVVVKSDKPKKGGNKKYLSADEIIEQFRAGKDEGEEDSEQYKKAKLYYDNDSSQF